VSRRAEAALAAVSVTAVLAVAAGRLWQRGKAEALEAERAAARADWGEATAHARTAAEACVPGSPWPDRGKRLLQQIGESAAVRGDRRTALGAFGALRAAAIATSPLLAATEQPWRRMAEDGLERMAAPGTPGAPDLRPTVRAALTNDPSTAQPWTVAALAAAGWALGIGVWLRARADASSRAVRLAGTVAAGAFAAYALALLLR
jgi:hypothetical protein